MRSEYITKKQYKAILDAVKPRNALPVLLSLETGIRVGDAVRLTWENINGHKLTYTASKTGKTDHKTISDWLLKQLKLYGGSDYLFPSPRGNGKHISRQTVYRAVKKAARSAGITANVTPHTARKIYAVEMRDAVGMKQTQKLLQHTSADVTAMYAFSDVALGGTVTAAELDRVVQMIANRTAKAVVRALHAARKKNTP